MLGIMAPTANTKMVRLRPDLPGRFSEVDLLRRQLERIVRDFEGDILPPFEVLIHPSSAC